MFNATARQSTKPTRLLGIILNLSLLLLFLLGLNQVNAQKKHVHFPPIEDEWTVPMTVSLASGEKDSLTFGTKVGATDTLDTGVDLLNPPAPPPPDDFDAFFEISQSISLDLSDDFRSNSKTPNSWNLMIVKTDDGVGTINWDASDFPTGATPGKLEIRDGETVLADMLSESSVNFVGDQDLTIFFEAPSTEANISGTVTYCPTDGPVENVDLDLSGASQATVQSDTDGAYTFENLTSQEDYTVTPTKNGDIGFLSISCFDAALTAQIAVGILSADHCDSLAVDVDRDGNIFTFDAALTCRFAVGLPPFNENDKTGEWQFEPTERSYEPLNVSMADQDFVATLLGDTDGNWTPASTTPLLSKGRTQHLSFAESPEWDEEQRELTTSLRFDGEKSALAFDLDLRFDPRVVRFVKASTSLGDWKLFANETEEGRLRLGMYATTPINEPAEFVQIKWEVLQPTNSIHLSLEKAFINATPQTSLELSTSLTQTSPKEFRLYQNYPNPFNPETRIGYDVPSLSGGSLRIQISVYNLLGQRVRLLVDENQSPGYHETTWDGKDDQGQFVPSGIYVVQIKSGVFVAERKMVLLK